MSAHRVIEYFDRKILSDRVLSHPALAGITMRGFLISDDKRACIIVEPDLVDVSEDECP